MFSGPQVQEHNISGDRLLQLTSEDLKDMGSEKLSPVKDEEEGNEVEEMDGTPKIGGKPSKWMVKIMENLISKWMISGAHPYFWKLPNGYKPGMFPVWVAHGSVTKKGVN